MMVNIFFQPCLFILWQILDIDVGRKVHFYANEAQKKAAIIKTNYFHHLTQLGNTWIEVIYTCLCVCVHRSFIDKKLLFLLSLHSSEAESLSCFLSLSLRYHFLDALASLEPTLLSD